MRVLSFIPAFLLAAASFVAAAPTAPTNTGGVTVPTCSPSTTGNDAPVQPIIAIIANATAQIQVLSGQLDSCNSGTPDANTVSGIVVNITAVISTCVAQLKAVVDVDLTGLDLTSLGTCIYAHLSLVLHVLSTLIAIVVKLGVSALVTIETVVCNLLHAVGDLLGCLKIFVVAALSGVLGPVLILIDGCVEVLLNIFVAVKL